MGFDISKNIALAAKGDIFAAVRLAAFMFINPMLTEPHLSKEKYNEYLSLAYESIDPELLVEVGKQLYLGKKLFADAPLSYKFFKRADELSSFKGSYVLACLIGSASPSHAIKLLKKGEDVGHLPSRILRHFLISKKYGVFFPLIHLWFKLFDTYATYHAMRQENSEEKLWRHHELSSSYKLTDDRFGSDQRLQYADLFTVD